MTKNVNIYLASCHQFATSSNNLPAHNHREIISSKRGNAVQRGLRGRPSLSLQTNPVFLTKRRSIRPTMYTLLHFLVSIHMFMHKKTHLIQPRFPQQSFYKPLIRVFSQERRLSCRLHAGQVTSRRCLNDPALTGSDMRRDGIDDPAKLYYLSSDRLQYNCKRKVVRATMIIFLNHEIFLTPFKFF